MDGWSVAMWAIAAVVAVSALVRLMVARRNKLVAKFRAELTQERERRAREDRKKGPDKTIRKGSTA